MPHRDHVRAGALAGAASGAALGGAWGLIWSVQRALAGRLSAWPDTLAHAARRELAVIAVAAGLGAIAATLCAAVDRATLPWRPRHPALAAALAVAPALALSAAVLGIAAHAIPPVTEFERSLRLVVPLWAVAGLLRFRTSHPASDTV